MTNKKPSTASTDKNRLYAIIGGAALIIAGSFGANAIADTKPFQHAKLYLTSSADAPTHTAGWRGHGDHKFSTMSEADIKKRVDRMVGHLAVEIEANDEQKAKIATLVTALAKDLQPLRDEFRDAGMQMKTILLAESVDRNALEKLRAERIARADNVSRDIVKAAADVSQILTPEQRQTVAERIEQLRKHRHGFKRWHRG